MNSSSTSSSLSIVAADRAHRGGEIRPHRDRRDARRCPAWLTSRNVRSRTGSTIAERRERAVEFLDEDILLGPARDADGVDVGLAAHLRRKARDRGLHQRGLRELDARAAAVGCRGIAALAAGEIEARAKVQLLSGLS